jgi:hypothetical protein
MTKFNHAVALVFDVISDEPHGEDITPAMYKKALLKRIASLDEGNEWVEAIGAPHDTYEEDKAEPTPEQYGFRIDPVEVFLGCARNDFIERYDRDMAHITGTHVLWDENSDGEGFMLRGSEDVVRLLWKEGDFVHYGEVQE